MGRTQLGPITQTSNIPRSSHGLNLLTLLPEGEVDAAERPEDPPNQAQDEPEDEGEVDAAERPEDPPNQAQDEPEDDGEIDAAEGEDEDAAEGPDDPPNQAEEP